MKLSGSAIAAIVVLVVALLAVPTVAAAQTRAAAQSVVDTTTATWGAVSTSQGGPAKVGVQAQATFPSYGTTSYFDIVNVGSVPISGQFLTVRSVALGIFGGPRDPSQTLIACTRGAWVGDKCKGTEVKLDYIGDLTFASNVPIKAGERVTVRVTNKSGYLLTLVTTVSVSVSGAHLPSATVFNN